MDVELVTCPRGRTRFVKRVEGLTFVCPSITNIFPSYNQQDATFLDLFVSKDTPHVSGGSSAHLRQHISVHTASGIVNQYCCLLLAWIRWYHLIHASS